MSNYHRIKCADCGEEWGENLNWAHRELADVIQVVPVLCVFTDYLASYGMHAEVSHFPKIPHVDVEWLRRHHKHKLHVSCEYADPCKCIEEHR